QRFGAYVDSALGELVQDLVAPIAQVLDPACRMFRIPVVADREIREHVHVRSLRQLVTLAGIANAFHSGTVHILGQSDDVGVLPSPVTALPELAKYMEIGRAHV